MANNFVRYSIVAAFLMAMTALWGLADVDAADKQDASSRHSLTGKMLVANPRLSDPRFKNAIVYVVDHDESGTFGLIVNKMIGTGPLDKFLAGFGVETTPQGIGGRISLVFGGPVEPDMLFLLHSRDYQGLGTENIDQDFAVTARLEALKDMAKGLGPRDHILAVGYAGWVAGQLQAEIDRADWSVMAADPKLIFGAGAGLEKWRKALSQAGLAL